MDAFIRKCCPWAPGTQGAKMFEEALNDCFSTWAGAKILAMSDEQVKALCRLEGHDPDDQAKLAKQAGEIAILRHQQSEAYVRGATAQRLADIAAFHAWEKDVELPFGGKLKDRHTFNVDYPEYLGTLPIERIQP